MRREDEHMHSAGYRMIVNNAGLSPPKSVAEFVGLETNFEKRDLETEVVPRNRVVLFGRMY